MTKIDPTENKAAWPGNVRRTVMRILTGPPHADGGKLVAPLTFGDLT